MLNLIKKDILIIKRIFLMSCFVLTFVPFFFAFMNSHIESGFSFLFMSVLAISIIGQAISSEEARFPEAYAVLCATPYRRRSIVCAKYIEFLALFCGCFVINGIVFRLIAPIKVSGLKESACAWFLIVLLTSFYLPLEIKYGAKQTKWFFASIIILASSGALFALRTASGFRRFADYPTIGTLSPTCSDTSTTMSDESAVVAKYSEFNNTHYLLEKEKTVLKGNVPTIDDIMLLYIKGREKK